MNNLQDSGEAMVETRHQIGILALAALSLSACAGSSVSGPDEALAELESANVACENPATPTNPQGQRTLMCNLVGGNWGPEGYSVEFDRDFKAFCGSFDSGQLSMLVVNGGSWMAGTGEFVEWGNTFSNAPLEPIARALGGEVMTLRAFCS